MQHIRVALIYSLQSNIRMLWLGSFLFDLFPLLDNTAYDIIRTNLSDNSSIVSHPSNNSCSVSPLHFLVVGTIVKTIKKDSRKSPHLREIQESLDFKPFKASYLFSRDSSTTVSTWHEEIRLIPISSAGPLIGSQEHIH